MQTYEQCISCFERQADDACRMVGLSTSEHRRVMEEAKQKIASFSRDRSPVEMGGEIHGLLRSAARIGDPYADIKQQSNDACHFCMPFLYEMLGATSNPFVKAVKLAIAGNIIDFGACTATSLERSEILEAVNAILAQPLSGSTPDELYRHAEQAHHILYIGDNAGECFFDRLLLERLPSENCTYAVRGGPILNDATLTDAKAAGVENICPVIDTGSRIPGVVPEYCSASFLETFKNSDLVIAKGQGNYESLSGRTDRAYVFLTKVKCEVIAHDTGYAKGANVIEKNL